MSDKFEVVVKSRSEAGLHGYDYRDIIEIWIDGERHFSVHDGEPEDNSLGRNFSACYGIAHLMEKAYEAGKTGRELNIIDEELED